MQDCSSTLINMYTSNSNYFLNYRRHCKSYSFGSTFIAKQSPRNPSQQHGEALGLLKEALPAQQHAAPCTELYLWSYSLRDADVA